MALILQDRVSVTSAGSGTGNLALGTAYPGYRTFASCIPDGSIVYYTIANQALGYENEWEVGYGTYVLSTDTLQRNTGNPATSGIYSSSNANAYVNFTAGTNGLQIFITYPSEQAVYQQPSGITEFNEGPISVVGANATAGTFSSTLGQFTSNEPNYSQLYIQNQSGDANASTDIAAYNELGDGTYFFVDMGIASSNYNSGDYPIFQQNDAYLYSYGNATTVSRLMIGTESPDANVVVFAGGVDTNNTALTISGTDQNATFANGVTVTKTLGANNVNITNFAYASGNIANAANNTVLVTQAYVDNATAAGIDIHDPVNLATVTVLSGSPSYNQPGGAGNGVGATLTAAGVGTLSVDGKNAAAGFRILVQSQANAVQNGVYTVTTEGTGGAAYVLTRATDSDTSTELTQGSYYFVNGGDTLAYNAFVVNTVGTINFGVTNITFAEFSRVPTYIGTSPINVSGQTISLTTVPVSKGGTNLTTFTTGDVVYANTANTLASLPIGSQYNSLVVSGAGTPSWGAIALGSANAVSGTLGATYGGTGQSSYTTGDILYSSAANTLSKLPGQTTTTQKFLSQTGDGSNSAAPTWSTIPAGSVTGLGTMSTQNANSVTITGGTLNNVVIGGSTPNAGTFTNVNATTVTATTGSFTNVSGNGATLTNINASNISSGTIANARTTGTTSNSASTLVLRDANGSFGANIISASFNGDGSAISAINASNLSSGTVANARTTADSANSASTIVQRDSGGNFSANTITANVSGSGAGLTNINASNISSGTIGNAYTTANTANSASTIVLRDGSGAFAAGQITATSFSGNGSAITAINASNISSGTLDNARTNATSANGASTLVVRDANGSFAGNVITGTTGTFTSVSGNGVALTAINASNITSGTISNAYTTANSANGASTIVARDVNGNFSANIITATFAGNASTITNINASNITSGTISNAYTTANSANGASTIVARDSNGSFTANVITGTTGTFTNISGNGVALTAINASNVTSGTLDNARTTASSSNGANTIVLRDASGDFSVDGVIANWLTGNGANISAINGSNVTTGTIANARTTANSSNGASTIVLRDSNGSFAGNVMSANYFSGDGSNLSAINASSITTGTLGSGRLSGSYTGVTGVGNVTVGTWSANVVSPTYGGTGSANLTANNVILGNGANAVQVVSPGTAGNVLTSNGTTWVSSAATGSGAGTITRTDFTATAGQTVFTVSYPVGLIDVYRNGVKLATTDFTATNGTSFTLATGANAGDLIQAEVFNALNLYATISNDVFSGNGVQTTFTMSVSPYSAASTLVAVSGVVQEPSTYTVSTNTLTFSAAPPSGSNNISVRYLGVPAAGVNASTITAGVLGVAYGGTGLTSPGTAGNVLTSNGSAWTSSVPAGGGQFYGTATVKAIAYNAQTIGEDITILGTTNALSAGPITINTSFTVTIATGGNWVIV